MTQIPINQQNLIAVLGIESLADEKKLKVLEKITTLVQKRLLFKINDSLPPSFQEEFGSILESGDSEKLSAFLEERVPQLPELIEQETNIVKQELGEWASKIE